MDVLDVEPGDGPSSEGTDQTWRRPFAESDALLEYVRPLGRLLADGGAERARLRVPEDDTFDRYASHNGLGGCRGAPACSAALDDAIPGLDTRDGVTADPGPERSYPLVLAGQLAVSVGPGGAYPSFEGPHVAARDLGERYEEAIVRRSDLQWSDRSDMVPHRDDTWVILDERTRELWVPVATDSDRPASPGAG